MCFCAVSVCGSGDTLRALHIPSSLPHCALYNTYSKTFSGSHSCRWEPPSNPVPTQNSRARNATAPRHGFLCQPRHHELWSHPPWQCTLTYLVSTYSPTQEHFFKDILLNMTYKGHCSGNFIHILTVTKSKLTSQWQQLSAWYVCQQGSTAL